MEPIIRSPLWIGKALRAANFQGQRSTLHLGILFAQVSIYKMRRPLNTHLLEQIWQKTLLVIAESIKTVSKFPEKSSN